MRSRDLQSGPLPDAEWPDHPFTRGALCVKVNRYLEHAEAPDRLAELEKMVRDRRPQASIEQETSLGAVIGAHAGPGTVGFFWFTDPAI